MLHVLRLLRMLSTVIEHSSGVGTSAAVCANAVSGLKEVLQLVFCVYYSPASSAW